MEYKVLYRKSSNLGLAKKTFNDIIRVDKNKIEKVRNNESKFRHCD